MTRLLAVALLAAFCAPGEGHADEMPPPLRVAECVIDVASWDTLNVRTGPSTKHPIVYAIPPDACEVRVDWNNCRGTWCPVSYKGRRGWASSRYLG